MVNNKKTKIKKIISYILLAVYLIAMIVFLAFCNSLQMLPTSYMVIIGLVFLILGVLLAIMHDKAKMSIAASVLSIFLTGVFIFGCIIIQGANTTIREVTTAELQTDIIGVYVMKDDEAEVINDAKGYVFGIQEAVDRTNILKSVNDIKVEIDQDIDTSEYENMFTMVDALKEGEVGAIIVNEAYLGGIDDLEEYNWINTIG
ncbi:MAG: hypothetical protein ACK5LL_16420 [Suipraeoptans sp.]